MRIANKKYGRLIRADKPHVYPLLFLPAWAAILMASRHIDYFTIILCFIFFIGSITMRSAGCIINDIFDRKIDAQVTRTMTRPIASGEISIPKALVVLTVMLTLSFLVFLFLPYKAQIVAGIAVIMVIIYPLAKRFTYFAQIILGIVFNAGVLIGWLSISNNLSYQAILLYLGFVCMTVAYDTIYAFQDIDDDEKVGVKSMALFLKKNSSDYKKFIWGIYKFAFVCIGMAGLGVNIGLSFFFFLALAAYLLYNDLDAQSFECSNHFKNIQLYIFLIFIGILCGK